MAAVAKNPAFAKKVGIKQSVGEDFLKADKGLKFGTGGGVGVTYGGQGQINKQRTRFGSKFGDKLNVPDESLNKYEGKSVGGSIGRPDLQKVNKRRLHPVSSERKLISIMTQGDDCINNIDKSQQKEQREKILVPVRCHKNTDEEEFSAENDKRRLFEIPRRWHIY